MKSLLSLFTSIAIIGAASSSDLQVTTILDDNSENLVGRTAHLTLKGGATNNDVIFAQDITILAGKNTLTFPKTPALETQRDLSASNALIELEGAEGRYLVLVPGAVNHVVLGFWNANEGSTELVLPIIVNPQANSTYSIFYFNNFTHTQPGELEGALDVVRFNEHLDVVGDK